MQKQPFRGGVFCGVFDSLVVICVLERPGASEFGLQFSREGEQETSCRSLLVGVEDRAHADEAAVGVVLGTNESYGV